MISRLDIILFELIQVAIGNRSSLSVVPSCADEWASLRLKFKKQALLGIGYVGVTKLPAGQTPPIQVLAQWVHNAEKIRKKNERITGECVSLCEQLAHDGLWCCVLKGQSNLVNYQTSGWVFEDKKACGEKAAGEKAAGEKNKNQKNPLKESDTSCTSANSDSPIVSELPSDSQNHQTVLCQNSDSSKVDKPAPCASHPSDSPSVSRLAKASSSQKTDSLPSLADYRTPGDIDVWCAPFDKIEIAEGGKDRAEYVEYRGERAVIEYALMQARLASLPASMVFTPPSVPPLSGDRNPNRERASFGVDPYPLFRGRD